MVLRLVYYRLVIFVLERKITIDKITASCCLHFDSNFYIPFQTVTCQVARDREVLLYFQAGNPQLRVLSYVEEVKKLRQANLWFSSDLTELLKYWNVLRGDDRPEFVLYFPCPFLKYVSLWKIP